MPYRLGGAIYRHFLLKTIDELILCPSFTNESAFVSCLGTSETLPCSTFVLKVTIVLPLEASLNNVISNIRTFTKNQFSFMIY
jgi:hypothetical protein